MKRVRPGPWTVGPSLNVYDADGNYVPSSDWIEHLNAYDAHVARIAELEAALNEQGAALDRSENAVGALLDLIDSFPLPGLPGSNTWQHRVVKWWNNKARPTLDARAALAKGQA